MGKGSDIVADANSRGQFTIAESKLPARDQLHELARGVATEDGEVPLADPVNWSLARALRLAQ